MLSVPGKVCPETQAHTERLSLSTSPSNVVTPWALWKDDTEPSCRGGVGDCPPSPSGVPRAWREGHGVLERALSLEFDHQAPSSGSVTS